MNAVLSTLLVAIFGPMAWAARTWDRMAGKAVRS